MNAIVIEGKEYHFKMAHPENTEEILSLYQSAMGTEGCTWDETYPSRETIAKDFANQGGDAIKLLDWLVERETFYPVEIHTANPVGRANMESVLARYWGEEYW